VALLISPASVRLARIGVSLGLVALLIAIIPLQTLVDALSQASPAAWSGALAVFFAGHVVNALKLRLLIGPSMVDTWPVVQAQFVGLAANLGLPGVAGGDVIRAAVLARRAGTPRVVLASVADRAIDTVTLLVLAGFALPLVATPTTVVDGWRLSGWLLLGVTAGGTLLAWGAVRVLARRGIAEKAMAAWAELRRRPGAVAWAVALSLVVQSAFVVATAWIGRSVGLAAPLAEWFIASPLAKLVAIIPISLNGIGVREAALVSLMESFGEPRAAVLATGLLWQAVLVVGALTGLLFTQAMARAASGMPGTEVER
jgi:uncharacterized membrane protein YbhN (UPF0104 family)